MGGSSNHRDGVLATCVSVLAHAVLALVGANVAVPMVAQRPDRDSVDDPLNDFRIITPPPEPEPVVFGITESDQTINQSTLGFSDPTPEHLAPLSEVVQPALDPNPGSGRPGSAEVEPAPVPPTVVEPPRRTAEPSERSERVPDAPPASEQPRTTPASGAGTERASSDAGPTPTDAGDVELPIGPPAPPTEALEVAIEQLRELLRRADASPAPAQPPSQPAKPPQPAVPQSTGDGREAIQSEKGSDATSLREPIRLSLGKPSAVEGLEIFPPSRPPRFRRLSLLRSPGNPVLLVGFDRTGTVRSVEVERSSGYLDVDEPIQTWAHAVRARGRLLDELPDTPPARLKLRFEILLR